MAVTESSTTTASFVEREIVKGVVHLARHKEFYGHIVQQFEKVYVNGDHPVRTAAVGCCPGERFIKLYLNTDFFGKIYKTKSWKCLLGALEHEILHIVFNHLFLVFEDRLRGNVAMDLVVNSVLSEDVLPDNCLLPSHYGFERNKSAMWYYTHLRDNKKYKQQCASGAFGVGGLFSYVMSSHSLWENAKKNIIAREFIKDVVRKSKDLCGGHYGDIPGEVVEQIDNLLKVDRYIVPWNKVLRMFVASCAESVLDYTIKRISHRYNTRPGTQKGDVLNLAVAIDTSGSIDERKLKLFFNEIWWIWKNGATITVYEADCKICNTYKFNGKFTGKVSGRGGTDLEPVLKEVEGRYDALIYFTDFEAPKIRRRYRIPILWVLTTDLDRAQYPYQWGRYIKIEDDKAIMA